MSDNGDNLVPIFGIFCSFGLPVLAFIAYRYFVHRERMEMLQRGMMPPDKRGWRRMQQQQGANWAPPWTAGPPPVQPAYEYDDSAQCALRRGITTAFVGLALLIGLSFIGYHSDGPLGGASIHPGPWLLGGLIPLFVGLAQIVIALLSGAQMVFNRMMPPPPGAPPPAGPSQRSYGAPEPARPAPRYEELARPVKPPDRT